MTDVLSKKLHPSQASIDAGQMFKHLHLTLRHDQTIAGVHEDPDLWQVIQGNLNTRVSRGDEVTIISADGLQLADRCRVVRAQSGAVWLSKPLRMVELQDVALFQTPHHEVVPVGTGFSVRTLRGGVIDPKVFQTEEQAKMAVLQRSPVAA